MRTALDPEGRVVWPTRRDDCVCPECDQSWCRTCQKTTATLLNLDRVRKCDECHTNRGLGRRWEGVSHYGLRRK